MDCLAIGAHPDDAELFAGGTLASCIAKGYEVGILHLTRGECGTRGSAEERRIEAGDAAKALGVAPANMAILDLGDARLANSEENRLQVIRIIRQWRPRLVLHHLHLDRHPDHRKASRLCEDACFYAGLARIGTDQEAYRPPSRLMFFNNTAPSPPADLIVDISDFFERKMAALAAYRSQFHNPSYPGPVTYISSPEFIQQIETRARYYGAMIGARYGEPFRTSAPLRVNDPLALLGI